VIAALALLAIIIVSAALEARLITTTPDTKDARQNLIKLGLFSRDAAEEHKEMFDYTSLNFLARQAGLRVHHYGGFLLGVNQLFVLAVS
jgi:hypothetical protein